MAGAAGKSLAVLSKNQQNISIWENFCWVKAITFLYSEDIVMYEKESKSS